MVSVQLDSSLSLLVLDPADQICWNGLSSNEICYFTLDSLVRSAHTPAQSSGLLLVLRCEKVFIRFAHCYCFSVGLRSKRFRVVSEQRETEKRSVTGFSVWAARKMELTAIFLAVFDPHFSFFSLKPHGNARVIRVLLFSEQKWPLPVAGSVSRNVATTGSGERRGCILLQGIHFSQPSKHIAACYRRSLWGWRKKMWSEKTAKSPSLIIFPRLLTSGRTSLFKRLQLEQATRQIQTWT